MQHELKNRWALITGASSGLGAEFARQLAAHGCHLILVARRTERLQTVQYRIQCRIVPLDLTAEGAVDQLYQQCQQWGVPIDILINNAGFGQFGDFMATNWANSARLLQLNIVALTHLTRLFVADMVPRNQGYVVLLASIAAYQPVASYATYAASKSYVLHFGEALHHELRHTHVTCTVLAPGMTRTEFFDVAGQAKPNFFRHLTMMDSPTVVRQGIQAMVRGRSSVMPGWLNNVTVLGNRLLPRWVVRTITHRLVAGFGN